MMLRVDWSGFGQCVRAHADGSGLEIKSIAHSLGISRPTLYRAFDGKTLKVEQFLTLCHWMQQDPMWFCVCGGSGQVKSYRSGKPIPCIYGSQASTLEGDRR
jgi:hypothetical protein